MQIKDPGGMVGAMSAWIDICIQTTVAFAELKQYEQTQSHEQDMCEHDIEVWEDGDKIRCIDDSEQNTLKLNEVLHC